MAGPFDLANDAGYRAWREDKLADYPLRVDDLIVEVRDPARLSAAERRALVERCARTNMAIYASPGRKAEDKNLPRLLGAQLGLGRLDRNWLADEDAISAITPGAGTRGEYIPYTERAIRWHTDGYYHPPAQRILGMILHCVRPAAEGGESALLDHEIAYLKLRDENPMHVRALSEPDAMTIPPRLEGDAVARPAETGPVFSTLGKGETLHMRYTARGTNIAWKDDAATRDALAALERVLGDDGSRWIFRLRLEAGMGIVCNNVLHSRCAFRDPGVNKRLLYRLRYLDRVAAR
jgi:hypothetical protein